MQLDFYHGGTAFGFATAFWGATSAIGSIAAALSSPAFVPPQEHSSGVSVGSFPNSGW